MEFKGTKAKFKTKYVGGFIRVIDKDGNNVLDTPWKHINEANALLISKAPEMLEMLKELIYAFERKNLHAYKEERLEEAKQLIKEATEI